MEDKYLRSKHDSISYIDTNDENNSIFGKIIETNQSYVKFETVYKETLIIPLHRIKMISQNNLVYDFSGKKLLKNGEPEKD